MSELAARTATARSAAVARRQGRMVWWAAYGSVVFAGLLIAAVAHNRLVQPYIGMSLGLMLLLSTLWFTRPRAALYLTLFLATLSDFVSAAWFPFTKNLSSRESIAFVADAFTISPLEISLILGLVVSTLGTYGRTGRLLPPNPLVRPMFVLLAFVIFGFARGVLTGGNLTIAVFESRGLFYTVATFIIALGICTEPKHYQYAVAAVFVGVLGHALITMRYFFTLTAEERADLESLGEHGASVTMGLVFLALFAGLLFKSTTRLTNLALAIIAVPVAIVFLLAQRRAAVAALGVAMLAVLIMLAWRRKRTFIRVVPVLAIVVVGYLGAFWNATGAVGFPAQAIKGAIAPVSLGAEELSSDLYRVAENYNVNYTIRTSPVVGLGFGKEFYRPVALPQITDFLLARYLPHNSFLWVWIKLGFFGFATMVYVFMKSIVLGVARSRHLPAGGELMTTVLGVGFVIMYAVYTWLDISWDSRLTPTLGLAIAMCSLPVAKRMTATGDEAPAARPPASATRVLSGARDGGAVRPREGSPPG